MKAYAVRYRMIGSEEKLIKEGKVMKEKLIRIAEIEKRNNERIKAWAAKAA